MLPQILVILAAACSLTVSAPSSTDPDWWEHASFYQIYPRSFKDFNNDGIGDLEGIIEKLDFLADAGVDAIWLSPIFHSPQVDQGYDISNYIEVDPIFGTNEILKKLIDEAHARGIKVILDFVPNHTSDEHQWFIDSVDGVEEYKEYYVWADGKVDDQGERVPPNNWISLFKNSVWTWSEKRQQYYLHQFGPKQPDLNFRNPKVVEAMKNVLLFWLDNGVDGFRIDAVPYLFEDADLNDEPLSHSPKYNETDYGYLNHVYTQDLPETYDMIYQWRKLVDDYTAEHGGETRILMTEAYTDIAHQMLYYGTADGSQLGAHFTFNFNLITDIDKDSTAQEIVNSFYKWLDAVPEMYTSNWVLGNHDNYRISTRFGPESVDGYNMMKALLPGASVTYNGEEIGQANGEVSFEEGQDPSATDPESFANVTRDVVRTPYQWDDSVNAGFNAGAKPWLPVSSTYLEINLKKQLEDEVSHYKVYRDVARLRKDPVLISGCFQAVALTDDVLLIRRYGEDGTAFVFIFNKGLSEEVVDASSYVHPTNSLEIKSVNSTKELGSEIDGNSLTLDAREAVIIKDHYKL